MPSPFDAHGGRVLMLEPPWASVAELRAQLLDQTYPKPFVIDDGERRYLHFDGRLVQSAMSLAAPNALEVRYTQKMMSFLLFHSRPRRIVLIGLGGGSLVKFCHHRLPATHMTVLENNRDVIALRDEFLVPRDGPTLQVLEGDGAEYLKTAAKGIDVLLVDAFDRTGFAPGLANRQFLEQAHAKLAGSGVMVVNLAGDEQTYAGLIGLAMQVFDNQVIVFPVREDDNQVLLAFRNPAFEPNWRRLRGSAKELRSRYGLAFPDFLEKIERSAKLGLARREAERRC
ncbi:MAG: spermidine synthase-like protein [Rhodocyclales bacterium]|nr:spermidine synthase-like protein [Rhodocyclales bacterium]